MTPLIQNLWWLAPALIIALGVILGLGDLAKLSAVRIWAISSVCFAESIRRRVLLVVPLAMLGVIIVTHFQRPFDELDAIRQSTKFWLFAAGLVVTLTVIILACTNLPREIENRVIYTIVTKPTTRLEIVLGKVLGFARVSAAVLILFGLFAFGFLWIQASQLESSISRRLAAGTVDTAVRPTLEHYRDFGLLSAKRFERASSVQVFSTFSPRSDPIRWTFAAPEHDVVVPFVVDPSVLRLSDTLTAAIQLSATVQTRATSVRPEEQAPFTGPYIFLPESQGRTDATPLVSFTVLDPGQYLLIPSESIQGGQTQPVSVSGQTVAALITPNQAAPILDKPIIWVQVAGMTDGFEYGFTQGSIRATALHPETGQVIAELASPSIIGPDGRPVGRTITNAEPMFRGRQGTRGMQLRGGDSGPTPIAVYRFDAAEMPSDGEISGELRMLIERSGSELDDADINTTVFVDVFPEGATTPTATAKITPESNRPAFFTLPADILPASGNFDLVVRATTPGHYLGIGTDSIVLVGQQQYFAYNLVKSLLVIWLMSLLVIIISVFCSTFLSWPIAVVLTIIILMGRWGVLQLGDATRPGIGNMVATDLGFKDAATSKAVSASVEALSQMLNAFAAILPDISRFAFIEDLERGQLLPFVRLTDAGSVVLLFGLPMLVLAYVFLRNKEVAP